MKAIRRPVLALLAAALAGCLLPPFDSGLSLAYKSADKMRLVAEIGPVRYWGGGGAGKGIYFLPSRTLFPDDTTGLGATHGLVVAAGDYGPRVWYLDSDPAGGAAIYGDRQFLIDSRDDSLYNWQIFMINGTAGTGPDYFVLHDRRAAAAGTADLTRVQYDRFVRNLSNAPNGGTFVNPVKWSDMTTPHGTLVGVSFRAIEDRASFLEGSSGAYDEHRFQPGGSDWSPFVPIARGPVPLPVTSTNGFYQHDSNSGRSVFSFPSSFGYTTWVWEEPAPYIPRMLPIGRRIDVLLSTGELYHRGEGSDVVYGWDGKKKHEFPVGDLRLADERDVGGVATLIYTLVFREHENKDDDAVHLRVYTIPTADLDELD